MITINAMVAVRILFAHWVADFVCQTDWQAKNKSKSNKALSLHIATYTVVLAIILVGFPLYIALINGAIHWFVDYVTSRTTSKLWQKGDVHNFFVVIGADQWIHTVTLLLTYGALK